MACIHEDSSFFVGIGHPRCGTGFTASLLQAGGLRVGHEHVLRHGIVSWMLPGEKYRNPWRDAVGPLKQFRNIFCVARAPLAAMNSIIPENAQWRSLNFRRDILAARLGETLPMRPQDPDGVLTAVQSYTLWFELCMTFAPDMIFRVDRPEDDALLSEYVQRELTRSDRIDRNSRPDARASHFEPQALAALPPDLLARFAAIADTLGYPEDAAIIRDIASA